MKIKESLNALRRIQAERPDLIVGGSIGLLLHGIKLPRLLHKELNDLDFVSSMQASTMPPPPDNTYPSADDSDCFFELAGVMCDVRCTPEAVATTVVFEGNAYKVQPLEHILWWKRKYAARKVLKHIDDLKYIAQVCPTV